MKTIITFTIFSVLGCKAQTPIVDIYGPDNYASIENAYYKDVQNFHDQYVGTWLYTNSTNSLKVILTEKTLFHNTGGPVAFFEDIVVGEYQYVYKGVELVNTLANLNVNHVHEFDYNLHSVSQMQKNKHPVCQECEENEKRLNMTFKEPALAGIDGMDNQFVIRRFFDGQAEKLKIWFVPDNHGLFMNQNLEVVNIEGFSLPHGTYILTKQ